MVRIIEYKPDEFMINVNTEEAILIIKSLATQIANNDPNRGRHEFGKRNEDDVTYFSIALDPKITEFQVISTHINGKPIHNMVFHRSGTLEGARDFIEKSNEKMIDINIDLHIKEVEI